MVAYTIGIYYAAMFCEAEIDFTDRLRAKLTDTAHPVDFRSL